MQLRFEKGYLQLQTDKASVLHLLSQKLGLDAPARKLAASQYRSAVMALRELQLTYEDQAAAYAKLNFALQSPIQPRDHQTKALAAWRAASYRGVVCLPTGAGKTFLAMLAIAELGRSTLVVVPTLELLRQWRELMTKVFGVEVGQLGGGVQDLQNLVVSTYDSALIYASEIGDKFGLVVFDECHHLPAPSYRSIAESMIAPFRLGLSATLERQDGAEDILDELVGPVVYEESIIKLSQNSTLATYETRAVLVDLTEQERSDYEHYRNIYLNFIRMHKLVGKGGGSWQQFLQRANYLPGGRAALAAYRKQKHIYQNAANKYAVLWKLMNEHHDDRLIVFTDNNAQAYHIGRRFVVPVISHKTKAKERERYLKAFATGELKVLVTSKVLNEGIDVPEANVAVVVSGSGTVREHVQRLGRILRQQPGKKAMLYELITEDTAEEGVATRRRQHDAYRP